MTTAEMKELEEYKARCKKQGEHLVRVVFPRKVLELDSLLQSTKFCMLRLSDIPTPLNIPVPPSTVTNDDAEKNLKKRKYECEASFEQVPGSKVLILPYGVSPSNSNMVEIIEIVKPFIRDLIDHANLIKMWISYLIPRIEDGNNFGVSIQEDTLSEARQVESEAATYMDQISRYYITRGKIVSKVSKYPHVEDYRRTIDELDEKQFISMRLVICELRNQYASLHDLITKNLDKIKKPRNANTDNMY